MISGGASSEPHEPTEARREVGVPPILMTVIVGAIVLATALALWRSAVPLASAVPSAASAPEVTWGNVGVITSEIRQPGAAGRISALAPDFSWVTPDGKVTSLSALRGQPVVVNFWATWCVPCRTEMPTLDKLAAEHPEVAFLAVDLQEDPPAITAFFERLHLRTLVPLLDPRNAMANRYGVFSLPTTFFIDRDGVIRHLEIGGPLSEDRLRADLLKVTPP